MARDTLPEPGHMRAYVVNTDESTGRGVHWLAALDVNGQRYFNDPLGVAGADQRLIPLSAVWRCHRRLIRRIRTPEFAVLNA